MECYAWRKDGPERERGPLLNVLASVWNRQEGGFCRIRSATDLVDNATSLWDGPGLLIRVDRLGPAAERMMHLDSLFSAGPHSKVNSDAAGDAATSACYKVSSVCDVLLLMLREGQAITRAENLPPIVRSLTRDGISGRNAAQL